MSTVIALRSATAQDAAALAVLDAGGFEADPWDDAAWGSELAAANRRIVVAQEPGERGIVGVIDTMVLGDVADLVRIVVHPQYRRGGLARRLVMEALVAARNADAERMLLEVSSTNPGAIAFYRTMGFTQIDLRPRYYRDGSDALILMRAVEPSSEGSAE